MSEEVRCFLIEPADTAVEELRRFSTGVCSLPHGYHDATTVLGLVPWTDPDSHGSGEDDFDHADARWPTACGCGYVFTDADLYEHLLTRQFERVDSHERWTLGQAPPGAMWHADWFPRSWRGADNRCLTVKLPNGNEWTIDQPMRDGSRWVRTGEPPLISVTPSILSGEGTRQYHGFLIDGVLRAV